MIFCHNGLFTLKTKNTCYLFYRRSSGHLEHFHYGEMIDLEDPEAFMQKNEFLLGNAVAYGKEDPALNLENLSLEMSSLGKGDIREPFLRIIHENGSETSDFLYVNHEILKGKKDYKDLPSSYGHEDEVETLVVTLKDRNSDLELELLYHVYEEVDVITRSSRMINPGESRVTLERLMSAQIDFHHHDFTMITFTGAWAREMNKTLQPCAGGKLVNSTLAGVSGNRANPFFMIAGRETTEDDGDCYGFNLVYSGNHYSVAESSPYGKLRVATGINPERFSMDLGPGEVFQSPEAVISYSNKGFTGLSHQMHDFIRQHIVRGEWQWKQRPVLFNSWEAAYFKINEKKLLRLAKKAKEVGIELFVLDDGWFGKRNNDESSLGDWHVNRKKLPGGLRGLSEKINSLGLDFGIWVEPEMVSEDSDCYGKHPEWAVKIPGHHHSQGRNQMILDLSNKEVQEYVIDSMGKVFSSGNISYVKWDMNRIFSDVYSPTLEKEKMKSFSHRYLLGLYHVLETLSGEFPHILFEGCASGGNRFDLGMLCYMPQIWASDNTDAISRLTIQEGYSYGYPLSTMGAHVSDCPNHQTLRRTPEKTRYHVACYGLLGYECNLGDASKERLKEIKEEIRDYKKWREVYQFGDFYRISHSNLKSWMVVSKNRKKGVGSLFQILAEAGRPDLVFRGKGLLPDEIYHFYNIPMTHNVKIFGDLINTVSPVHIKDGSVPQDVIAKFYKPEGEKESYYLRGSAICRRGVSLKQAYVGTGFNDKVRVFQDFTSRTYYMEVE